MSVRPDNRLADAPMTPVDCGACGARVQVRKSSWEQTSVQWNADSRARCTRRRDEPAGTSARLVLQDNPFAMCPDLRESIDIGVRHGTLPVLDETEFGYRGER